MTYGWALIVVAVIIGILWYVTSSTGAGVTCVSQDNKIVVKEFIYGSGALGAGVDGVKFTLQNGTGGEITLVEDAIGTVGDNCVTDSDSPLSAHATAVCDAEGTATTKVASAANFTVKSLTTTLGTISNASATVSYETAGGLVGTAKIVCNGKI